MPEFKYIAKVTHLNAKFGPDENGDIHDMIPEAKRYADTHPDEEVHLHHNDLDIVIFEEDSVEEIMDTWRRKSDRRNNKDGPGR
jgi:hypothetical protein